jgi:hypothetical protein
MGARDHFGSVGIARWLEPGPFGPSMLAGWSIRLARSPDQIYFIHVAVSQCGHLLTAATDGSQYYDIIYARGNTETGDVSEQFEQVFPARSADRAIRVLNRLMSRFVEGELPVGVDDDHNWRDVWSALITAIPPEPDHRSQ